MTKLSFGDYCWALTAFIRGKMLRQQAYLPQNNGVFMAFRTSRGATVKRRILLMRMWGYRPMTHRELSPVEIQTDCGLTPLPSAKWVDGKWNFDDKPDE